MMSDAADVPGFRPPDGDHVGGCLVHKGTVMIGSAFILFLGAEIQSATLAIVSQVLIELEAERSREKIDKDIYIVDVICQGNGICFDGLDGSFVNGVVSTRLRAKGAPTQRSSAATARPSSARSSASSSSTSSAARAASSHSSSETQPVA